MNCKFDRIYQFGDSLSDTGNCLRESYCGAHSRCRKVPYGMDFYQNASGRCSNGMLIIDFIAIECGLPLLNPYKDENAEFRHGVNFAVVGATALTTESLAQKNIVNPDTNSSLSVQLDWMSSHFQTTCSPADCPEKLNKSLFLVGEIGGNEFIYGLTQDIPCHSQLPMVGGGVGGLMSSGPMPAIARDSHYELIALNFSNLGMTIE
ncbi:hypothetical protein KY290_002592 [Solanum tuberosum]|uniref:Acetylajmalan esterase-like n=1 Tax=Solanum tuberosum TaxID=4113 RepID=A0ABQ7WQI1_SOLTU|nr:hypothetical protein KY290_002592 [Solanum tuberosum]